MVREARFSKDDAGGFDIPEARDSFDDLDDMILDGFSSSKGNKSRKRRKKTGTAPSGERPGKSDPSAADRAEARQEQPPSSRE